MSFRLIVFLLVFSLLPMTFEMTSANPGATQRSPQPEIRALWVTRWDYRTADDVRKICYNAASLGCNRIFFQVRGESTCFYPSRIDPWAWELTGRNPETTGRDPGWDPLAVAIAEAHRYGVELHAYMNVLTAWKHPDLPPEKSNHVFAKHPEWIMVDRKGRPMSPARDKFYAFLNPCLKDVRTYLVKLFGEVVAGYPSLDGIHLDYIRFPAETGEYTFDPETLANFRRDSGGGTPDEAPAKWDEWRAAQINRVLAEISGEIRCRNPRLEISAAVVANYKQAVGDKAQRWLEWPGLGLVETVVPMAYHYDKWAYLGYLKACLESSKPSKGKVVIGIWPAEKWEEKGYDLDMLTLQVEMARRMGADGISFFAYSTFFPGHKPNRWALHVRTHLFNDTVLKRFPETGHSDSR
ncbi:family 10 glycosylhydrolase [bacterium]|nr:family 10 glycosylhydrolase [bacterium]